MALALHTIKPARGSKKNKKRIGRGLGSGHGTYSTRGAKGQRARSGGSKGLKLKGLRQNLLNIPKLRGFKSRKPKMNVVNLNALEKKFKEGEMINPKLLLVKGVVKGLVGGVKILGDGEITKKIVIEGCRLSAKAKEKIVKAGGKVIELKKKG
ncbi:MAG: 50S ribosomal protein L15 [Patescibacteria group bacterium]|nr:50S ribosomal protein L15 [Patescibacteria group bacterium]MDD5490209.1 50S ribosomal protein L15 [Patescibacteria group bacterium]